MFEPKELSKSDVKRCLDTISPNAFYMLVTNALIRKSELSVVRMGDGERRLVEWCNGLEGPPDWWMRKMGIEGIDKNDLMVRMNVAAEMCSYFAPSISGILNPKFDLYSLFPKRSRYVDNFFVNAWTEEMKIQLFRLAGHVLLIHGNAETADAMQIRSQRHLQVKVSYLKLTNWQQADHIVDAASTIDAPLVLFSAGPGSKYIGPLIASSGNIPKVTLDIGNAADEWTLSSLHEAT